MRRVKRRSKSKGLVSDLTLEDIKKQWDKQKGICPYSGVELYFSNNEKVLPYNMASLDRIDSGEWYVRGNIQFVSTSINYAKNDMSHDDMILLCKLITERWK